jgi:DNA-binding MarR family transcriptional regulator
LSDSHAVRGGIIATVVGGVVLAILQWIWIPARDALALVWGVLTASVPVPIGLLVILLALALPATVKIFHRLARNSFVAAPGPAKSSGDASPNVSEFETKVMERIAKADGEEIDQDAIVRSLRTSKTRVQAAVDRLEELDLVEIDSDYEDSSLSLTARGRRFVVDRNMV